MRCSHNLLAVAEKSVQSTILETGCEDFPLLPCLSHLTAEACPCSLLEQLQRVHAWFQAVNIFSLYIVHEIDRKGLELGNPREVGVCVSFSRYMGSK